MRRIWATLFAVAAFSSPALSQNYNQFVAFGDSTIDAGWFANAKLIPTMPNNPFDNAVAAAVAAGGNAHFTGPGPGNAQILAGFLGLTANAANTPGGTNYGIGGAFINGGPGPFAAFTNIELINGPLPLNPALPSTTGQISNYLASVGGHANPNALYSFSTGGNDVFASLALGLTTTQATPYLLSEASALATSIAGLQAAGARYIIMSNQYLPPSVAGSPTGVADGTLLQTAIWSDLAKAGVKFIPADTASVIAAVVANPALFGITDTVNFACGGASVTCTPAQVSPANALQTHLFIDMTHLTEAGQLIEADYEYSLVTAPSEISFLAESAVKTRLGLVSTIQNQIDASETHRGPRGFNAWVSGDVSSISMDNYHGFPGDPDTVWNGAAGVDFTLAPGLIGGVAASLGTLKAALGQFGSFKQQESTASLYAAYTSGPIWGSFIGTAGSLDYTSNRAVPIGITVQSNNGSTSGDNWSAAFQGGYKFWNSGLTHGPIAGFVYQNVNVSGFTESNSLGITNLSFGDQNRESAVGQIGYKASFDWSNTLQPFAQLTWNHEFADTNRNVTASLTSIAAPSFSLPAVLLGKDWGEVKGGFAFDIGGGGKALVVGSADFGQSSATVYGGQIGVNFAF